MASRSIVRDRGAALSLVLAVASLTTAVGCTVSARRPSQEADGVGADLAGSDGASYPYQDALSGPDAVVPPDSGPDIPPCPDPIHTIERHPVPRDSGKMCRTPGEKPGFFALVGRFDRQGDDQCGTAGSSRKLRSVFM